MMMNKSDLDTYQNIEVSTSGLSNSDGGTVSSSSNGGGPNKNIGSLNQACQICGAALRIDSTIQNVNEATYRQLSTPFSSRDEIDTTISGNVVDADMEMSITAAIGVLNGLERSSMTPLQGDLDDIIDGGASSKMLLYEPIFRSTSKSMMNAPRSFYL